MDGCPKARIGFIEHSPTSCRLNERKAFHPRCPPFPGKQNNTTEDENDKGEEKEEYRTQ